MKRLHNNSGFTLIEMLVVMAVFVVIIAITGESFKTILSQSAKLFRSEESNIEGIVGLEMLRHDIQQAGFGLFTETSPVAYTDEAATAPASAYNDGTTGPPRPLVTAQIAAATNITGTDIVSSSDATYSIVPNSDYLVVKATSVGRSAVAQKWTYLRYSSPKVTPNIWRSGAENFATQDRVVLLQRKVTKSATTSELVKDPSTATNSHFFAYSDVAFDQFSSASSALMTVYGVDKGPVDLRMPFNRADYFVAVPPTKPLFCSGDPNVGTLYKMTVNHDGGKLNPIPLLDCVADMQIVLGWDLQASGVAGNDGMIDTWSNADGTVVTTGGASSADVVAALLNAATIRNSLKLIKVYVLAQNGRRDPGYTSPASMVVGDTGETSLTHSYTFSAEMRNFRWKVYRIINRPKNLASNQ